MDHYTTLGISKTASPDEIKRAYRKMASIHHPDKGGSTDTFQKIEEAYRILSNPETRQQYDKPMPSGFNFSFGPGGVNIDDILSQFFNQHAAQQVPKTYRTTVWLTLEQAYTGYEQALNLQTEVKTVAFKVVIPAGVQDTQQLRYDNIIPGAILIIEYRIHKNLKFERRNNDLLINHPVSILDLIVGNNIEVDTISNKKIKITIPERTQPNSTLRISGHGMPLLNSQAYGDLFIQLKPYMPATIDSEIINAINKTR
jgi:curved DNA-binding protein